MKRVFVIFLNMILFGLVSFGQDVVIYPKFQSKNDVRFLEQVELLKTALEKTKAEYGPYSLMQSKSDMNELRYIEEVKEAKAINVIWYGTNESIEKELIPIRIPIGKGILGYRIFLINKNNQNKFREIKTLEDLKKYSVGQGIDWGDVKVLEAAGITVVKGNNYEGLFGMLATSRFDYFSRGVNEAYDELETRKDKFPNMTVEETITLYYPWPYYFFVSPKTPKVAERIEKGLNIMIKDGSFDKIFNKYNRESIIKANLKGRKIIKIKNSFLPKKTPLERKELWFTP